MLNSVNLIGRLTRDPNHRTLQSGSEVTDFTLAVDDLPDKQGNKKTIFITVNCWNKLAGSVATYTKKGSLVGVSGRLTQRKYTNKAGAEVTATEIVANSVEFLESKGQSQETQQAQPQQAQPQQSQGKTSDNVDWSNVTDLPDDQLPF